MAESTNLLTVGRLSRPHGLQGEMNVKLTSNRNDRLDKGSVLVTENGDELVVAHARPKDKGWIVRFEGYSNRNAVEALQGLELLGEPIDDDSELWVHELIGLTVLDQSEEIRGVVESVDANPASDLLVLDTGHLIPVRFVERVTDDSMHVVVPDGLFDLQ